MRKSGDYYIVVVEDTQLGQIVATATLIIEHKFIHGCAKVAHDPSIQHFSSSLLVIISISIQQFSSSLLVIISISIQPFSSSFLVIISISPSTNFHCTFLF